MLKKPEVGKVVLVAGVTVRTVAVYTFNGNFDTDFVVGTPLPSVTYFPTIRFQISIANLVPSLIKFRTIDSLV